MIRFIVLFAACPAIACADPPVIENVLVSGTRFDVTLSHSDTGWDHYADGWEVRTADGTVLGHRVLHHPHVAEQPFTRSMKIPVPEGVTEVFVFAKDNQGNWTSEGTQVQTD